MAILTQRNEKAIAINLLGRKVLIFDATGAKTDHYDGNGDPHWAGEIVHYPSRFHDCCRVHGRRDGHLWGATLHRVNSTRPGDRNRFGQEDYFYLMSDMVGLDNDESWQKYADFAKKAQSQIIEEGDKVSILVIDKDTNKTKVHCVIAKDIGYSGYSTCGYFVDEPYEDIKPLIDKVMRF